MEFLSLQLEILGGSYKKKSLWTMTIEPTTSSLEQLRIQPTILALCIWGEGNF